LTSSLTQYTDFNLSNLNSLIVEESNTRTTELESIASNISNLYSSLDNNFISLSAAIRTETETRVGVEGSLATSISTLQAESGTNTLAIQTEATARATETGQLFGKYTVKIDNNGYVSGFGLASEANNGTPTSSFIVRADSFSVVSPDIAVSYLSAYGLTQSDVDNAPTWQPFVDYSINDLVRFYNNDLLIDLVYRSKRNFNNSALPDQTPSHWEEIAGNQPPIAPLIVQATYTTDPVTGKTIPPGVYMTAPLYGNSGTFSGDLSGATGTFSGNLQAASGTFSGELIAATGSFSGNISAASGFFSGDITGATGTFSGTLGAGAIDLSRLSGTTTEYGPGAYIVYIPEDFTSMRLVLIGGGGGGAGATASYNEGGESGDGGGGGGVSIMTWHNMTPGEYIYLSVGSGGAGAPNGPTSGNLNRSAGGNGADGGNTYVAGVPEGYFYAFGGKGAIGPISYVSGDSPGAGGLGTTTNGSSGSGDLGYFQPGGKGGNTTGYGVGGDGGIYAPYNFATMKGKDGTGYGAGGGGGSSSGNQQGCGGGGRGANGFAIIEFFNPNGIVGRIEWNNLMSALAAQGISTGQ
jgi:hypothetical protein